MLRAKHPCRNCQGPMVFLHFDPEDGQPWFICAKCHQWHNSKDCCFSSPDTDWLRFQQHKEE